MRLQIFSAILFLAGSVVAQEKVPDPEIERAAFKVADGFEVSLFAADPLIAKPIGMNFDQAGRLWVTSSTLYPQIRPGEVADDKIIVLEDKDGDGKAEAGKVFAEGLYVPEGVVWGDGGVYVGASTELLHFKDTDGDGKADVRRVVLSGFGTEDTHHTIHTLRFGPDGQLYFNQSIYIHSHIETPWGPRRLSGSGTWRLRPRTMELEVLTRGLVNPWGHTWDQFGQEFATDGAGSDGVSIYIPGAAYGSWGTDAKRWIGGVNPGSPKYCGAEIVGGRHLPEDWQGSLITNDFRANRIVRFVLREEGAGYTAKLMSDVIKSSDKAFRPVDVKMGPDGAIYIADWYNPVINHGEVDFRSPMRDHTHGRIWRLTAKGRKLVERPKIAGESIEKLLELLKAPEQYTRQMARRELYERDAKEVSSALSAWLKNAQSEQQRLEALWTYETIDVVEPRLLAELMKAKDAHVRAAATHAMYFWGPRLEKEGGGASPTLQEAVADPNPQVRLNAVIALGQIPSTKSIELAMRATEQPVDRWTDYALYLTINKLKDVWLPEVAAGKFTFNGNATQLAMALQALESGEAVAPLLSLLKRGTIPPDMAAGKMIGVIAGSGGPQELAELWDYLLKTKNQQALSAGLAALLSAANDRGVAPAVGREKVVGLIGAKEDAVALGAIKLAGAWREQSANGDLTKAATNQSSSETLRVAAIEALGTIGGKQTAGALASLAEQEKSIAVRSAAIRALAAMDLKGAAARAAEILSSNGQLDDPGSIISAFLARQDGGKTLAGALGDKKLTPDRAKLALRYIYSTGRPEPELSELLRKSADINTQMANLSAQQIKELAAEIASKGDAARGEIVFRSKTTSCFTCHALGGAGGNLGPDLSAVGSASPMEYLIESILDPNKNVKEGFEAIAITTKTNDFYAGIKVRQTEKELVLRDATNSNITLPLGSIKKQQNAGSLMPSGLADLLTRQELLDLVKFMSVLGTTGHDVSAAGMVVRRWEVLDRDLGQSNPVELDETVRFSPAYSTVGGELPISELPKYRKNVVRFVIEAATPGTVSMQVNSTAGLKAYINTSDLDLKNPTLELSRGGHLISIEIDREARSEPLKISFSEAANGAARMRIWTGR